jgi:hypothetical protein
MNENLQKPDYVEPYEEKENRSEGLMKKVLLYASFLVSIPLYLGILYLIGDPLVFSPGGAGTSHGRGAIEVFRLGGMSFSSIELKQVESKQELLDSLLFTLKFPETEQKQSIYLRIGSFENFTADSMSSSLAKKTGEDGANFAFADLRPAGFTTKAYLNFIKNFEARLPYPPVLCRLAGPLAFSPQRDGSIALEYTIAAGDEFEVEYAVPSFIGAGDEIVTEVKGKDEVYCELGSLNAEKIMLCAEKITPGKDDPMPHLLRIAEFLRQNGVYKADENFFADAHPVEQFLDSGMKGHCQHFAAALVALARAKGIPARVGAGFMTALQNDESFLIIRGMAHAWPEILTSNGWKVFDVSPLKSEMPSLVKKGLEKPDQKEINAVARKNARKSRTQAGLAADEEAPRMPSDLDSHEANFRNAENPGTLIKNSAKLAEFLAGRKKGQNSMAFYRKVILLLILLPLIFFMFRYAERLLAWLLKMLKPKTEEEEKVEKFKAEAIEKLKQFFQQGLEGKLSGKNLAEVFAVFSSLLATREGFARKEHETAHEFFRRICSQLNFRAEDGTMAANFFAKEVYGELPVEADDFASFVKILQQILEKVKIMN